MASNRQPDAQQLGAEFAGQLEHSLDAGLRQAARRRAPWPPDPTPAAFARDTAALRGSLRALLRLDPPIPPGPEPATREPLPPLRGWPAERLSWSPWAGSRWDALYLSPGPAARPTVVVLHGLSGSPEAMAEGELIEQLLRRELGVVLPRLAAGWPARLRLARKARLMGREWLGLETLALLRLVDLLAELPTVRQGRLAVYGFSRGGQAALLLAALELRLAAVGVGSWLTDRDARLLDDGDARQLCYLTSPEEEQFVPGWTAHFDDRRLAQLIAARPLLVTQGLDDPAVAWEQTEDTVAAITALYTTLGHPDAVRLHLFPGGHQPLPGVTAAFLAEALAEPEVAPLVFVLEPEAPAPAEQTRRRRPGRRRWLKLRDRRRRRRHHR